MEPRMPYTIQKHKHRYGIYGDEPLECIYTTSHQANVIYCGIVEDICKHFGANYNRHSDKVHIHNENGFYSTIKFGNSVRGLNFGTNNIVHVVDDSGYVYAADISPKLLLDFDYLNKNGT